MRHVAIHERDCRTVQRRATLKVGSYALAIILFGTAAINAGLAKELTLPSSQTGTAIIPSHQNGSSGDVARAANGGAGDRGTAAQSNAGTKGNGDAKSDKTVGATRDSGGIKGEPHAVPNPEGGAGTKGGGDGGAHVGAKSGGTGAGSNAKGGAGTKGMSDAGAQTGAQHNATGANPIDTRITVPGPSKSESAIKARDWNKAKIAVPSGNFRDRTSSPGMKDGVVRNAIGVLMPPRAATKEPDADGRGFTPAAVDGTARSIAGAALKNLASVGRPDTGRQISSPAPTVSTKANANAPPVNTELNHSVLTGTGIGHPGSGTGMIGGAGKYAAGVISGTSFRPKHP
jgi:hypothetical protein